MHVFPATAWTARDVYSELDENLFLSLDARGDGEPLTVLLAEAPRGVEEPAAPTRSVAMGPARGPVCVGSRAEGRWPAVAAKGRPPGCEQCSFHGIAGTPHASGSVPLTSIEHFRRQYIMQPFWWPERPHWQ